ncbi:segregation and condensation protein A [Planctomycetota bacterium]
MGDYRVNLDIFAGPLDLLLYLVRKEEVDIYDIPLTRITEQYIHYIELLKSFDIDLAGDFLVMAATLMHIKSAMLLPKDDLEQLDAEDMGDPRTELIRQLLEYKKFKDAANLLGDAVNEQKERHPRPNTIIEKLKPDAERDIDIDQVSVWDLLEAFDSIMQATGANLDISHIADDTPIDLYQIDILHRLQTDGRITFEQVFNSAKGRLVMIGLFLALLELIRSSLVTLDQNGPAGAIYLRALTDEPAELAVKNAIESLTVPDEENEYEEEAVIIEQHGDTQLPPEQSGPAIAIVEIPTPKGASQKKVVDDYENKQII